MSMSIKEAVQRLREIYPGKSVSVSETAAYYPETSAEYHEITVMIYTGRATDDPGCIHESFAPDQLPAWIAEAQEANKWGDAK